MMDSPETKEPPKKIRRGTTFNLNSNYLICKQVKPDYVVLRIIKSKEADRMKMPPIAKKGTFSKGQIFKLIDRMFCVTSVKTGSIRIRPLNAGEELTVEKFLADAKKQKEENENVV